MILLTFDGRSPFAIVKDGKLSEDFSRGKNAQEFAFTRDLNFALWKWNEKRDVNICKKNLSGL